MIVAFLDLLGFSWLVNNHFQIANDNLYVFNDILKTKIVDNKTNSVDSYPKEIQEFVKNTTVSSFQHVISISDSLIIGAKEENADIFIKQLSSFVASTALRTLSPFKTPFRNIEDVKSKYFPHIESGIVKYQSAFPILFRGGLCAGEDARFFPQFHIYNDEIKYNSVNIIGSTYINAYSLESTEKGPRLFCNNDFANLLSDNIKTKLIPTSKNNISEVLWTYYACETDQCSDDISANIKRTKDNLILPAINLINYYDSIKSSEVEHYNQLLLLLLKGIKLYALDHQTDVSRIKEYIADDLPKQFESTIQTVFDES